MNEPEMMECAWCQSILVPEEEGFCSKECHANNEKANRE